MYSILLILVLIGCQTVEECPDPVYTCPEVAVDYNDVSLEDCENRLGLCVDTNTAFQNELRKCEKKKVVKKKRGKK